MLSKSAALLIFSALASADVALYRQCGGTNWNGETNCVSGASCVARNQFYSQCLPTETGEADACGIDVADGGAAAGAAAGGQDQYAAAAGTLQTVYTSSPSSAHHGHNGHQSSTAAAQNAWGGAGAGAGAATQAWGPPAAQSSAAGSGNGGNAWGGSGANAWGGSGSGSGASSAAPIAPAAPASSAPAWGPSSNQGSGSGSNQGSGSGSAADTHSSAAAAPAASAPASGSGSGHSSSGSGGSSSVSTVSGGFSGTAATTRYWDCCKASCGWSGRGQTNPVRSCDKNDNPLTDASAQSGCQGGPAFMCSNQTPWVVSDTLAYGFAAATVSGLSTSDYCCTCARLTFSEDIVGKEMIVQITNTGTYSEANHFDIAIPGSGVGEFTQGCTNEFGSGYTWGRTYGGVSSADQCSGIPELLQSHCQFTWGDWWNGADNPSVQFEQVQCPQELIDLTGCDRA